MFMYNQQSLNRPVQMMPQTQTTDPDSDSSGFGFLSKNSSKAGAFDFIQDEIKAASSSGKMKKWWINENIIAIFNV